MWGLGSDFDGVPKPESVDSIDFQGNDGKSGASGETKSSDATRSSGIKLGLNAFLSKKSPFSPASMRLKSRNNLKLYQQKIENNLVICDLDKM